MAEDQPRILCVDDEPAVLDGLRRTLRREFDVTTAEGAPAGLARLEAGEEFAVIVSDLRMPEMDGVSFLARCRELAPDTTRVLLTGNADLTAAVAAVNEGNIFRLLSKPCEAATLRSALAAAAEQYRLVTAERVLLDQTLRGSVRMLSGALALALPDTFGQAGPIQRLAAQAAAALGRPEPWVMDLAATLAEIAAVTLPPGTLERHLAGEVLDDAERQMIAKLPEVAVALIADIPRLEPVREILRHQNDDFSPVHANEIPLGARILRASRDLSRLLGRGVSVEEAGAALASQPGIYDPDVLAILAHADPGRLDEREVGILDLEPGMTLLAEVRAKDGRLLVARGQEVSVGLIERLRNFEKGIGVELPLRVSCPREAAEVPAA